MSISNMEVAIFATLTLVWWISSVTFLLPFLFLLKFSKSFQDKWFSFIYLKVMKPIFVPLFVPYRIKAFDLLKDNLPQRSAKNPIKILEIGVGGGGNFEYYPEHSRLTALDMNKNFEVDFRKNQSKYPHIVFDRLVTSFAEDMKDIRDSSMDVVISTYVLCSVKSLSDCLAEIKRVLKPGGKFLFLEHVSYPDSDWSFSVQKMANPLWVIYFDGCELTRNLGNDIRKAGFRKFVCETVNVRHMMFYLKPGVYGLATK